MTGPSKFTTSLTVTGSTLLSDRIKVKVHCAGLDISEELYYTRKAKFWHQQIVSMKLTRVQMSFELVNTLKYDLEDAITLYHR